VHVPLPRCGLYALPIPLLIMDIMHTTFTSSCSGPNIALNALILCVCVCVCVFFTSVRGQMSHPHKTRNIVAVSCFFISPCLDSRLQDVAWSLTAL
jgi:hypothetical protein